MEMALTWSRSTSASPSFFARRLMLLEFMDEANQAVAFGKQKTRSSYEEKAGKRLVTNCNSHRRICEHLWQRKVHVRVPPESPAHYHPIIGLHNLWASNPGS